MSVEISRGAARFTDRAAGRMTWHAFSFGPHYDPARTGFGPMVCHDEHLLADGQGFEPHHHQGVEIVTWVLSGALRHEDSTQRTAELIPGTVGVFSTGTGVEHSEVAVAPQTRFVQVWLASPEPGEVSYAATPVDLSPGGFTEVARPLPDAAMSVARLGAGETVTVPAAPRRHLYVATGALLRSSLAEPLQAGDAFLLTADDGATADADLSVTAAVPTELILWSFS